MPSEHAARTAVPIDATVDKSETRSLLVGRYPYFVRPFENPQDLMAIDPDTGAVVPAIMFQNQVFWWDPEDATTAHDAITTLVTYDGMRYKIADVIGTIAAPAAEILSDSYLTSGLYWAQLHRYRASFYIAH